MLRHTATEISSGVKLRRPRLKATSWFLAPFQHSSYNYMEFLVPFASCTSTVNLRTTATVRMCISNKRLGSEGRLLGSSSVRLARGSPCRCPVAYLTNYHDNPATLSIARTLALAAPGRPKIGPGASGYSGLCHPCSQLRPEVHQGVPGVGFETTAPAVPRRTCVGGLCALFIGRNRTWTK